ncbi:MAG: hypothetical protein ACR65R_16600 [Methylomicrobium sp.]
MNNQPVWTVYDKLRTARLNVKYYGRQLQKLENVNFILELLLLATAPTSAVAGLWFWQSELGRLVWQYMGVAAALAAVVKPLLSLTKRIKEYESVLNGYRTLEYDLMEIKSSIEQKQKYDVSMQAELKKALQREKALVAKNPESHANKKLKRICEEDVRKELPPAYFFVPEE